MNIKPYLTGLGAIGGLLFLIVFADSYFRGYVNYEPFMSTFYLLFFLGGFIFTSRIFSELHQPEKSYQYLTIPASTLEKLIAQWLISGIGFILVSYIGLRIVAIVGAGLSSALFEIDYQWLHLSHFEFLKAASSYLVIQSVFFLGACYFRNHNFIKTILAIFIVALVLNVITLIVVYIAFGQSGLSESNIWIHSGEILPHFFTVEMPQVLESIFWYVMAPFFLVVSYFKLKERQV
jgi:hypothetical protein